MLHIESETEDLEAIGLAVLKYHVNLASMFHDRPDLTPEDDPNLSQLFETHGFEMPTVSLEPVRQMSQQLAMWCFPHSLDAQDFRFDRDTLQQIVEASAAEATKVLPLLDAMKASGASNPQGFGAPLVLWSISNTHALASTLLELDESGALYDSGFCDRLEKAPQVVNARPNFIPYPSATQ